MSSWLDRLPSHEREKIRARLRSPEEYERLRERVKGPEDLEHELRYNESLADLKFSIEMEPRVSESLRQHMETDIREKGIDQIFAHLEKIPSDIRRLIEEGKFHILIEAHPESGKDVIMVVPNAKVAEGLPLKPIFNEQYVSYMRHPDRNRETKEDLGLSKPYS